MNVAVGLGVLAATAALTGALIVGDSMRASLRRLAVTRLAGVDHALRAPRFFDRSLPERLARGPGFADGFERAVGVIMLRASCDHADSGARVGDVNLIGADHTFGQIAPEHNETAASPFAGDFGLILNAPLARELGAEVGDDVLLRVGAPATVSTETLLGRRDATLVSMRRKVRAIIPPVDLGAFSLNPRHQTPRNAYIPLATLQRLLHRKDRVNTVLINAHRGAASAADADRLQSMLQAQWKLRDAGLRVRVHPRRGYVSLESDRFLLEPAVEQAVRAIGADDAPSLGLQSPPGSVLTYLANEITIAGNTDGRSIPYSTVAAVDDRVLHAARLERTDGAPVDALKPGGILLNEWSAGDLNARPGDRIELTYYVTGAFGALETHRATFVLRGVVRWTDGADDPGWTPDYPGVTDTKSIADWDPPFPVDLTKVRDKDESYWDRHRTAPKAFVTLADGQAMWAQDAERFGRLTSMRVSPASDNGLASVAESFKRSLRERLDVAALGFRFEPVRARALAAGGGSTDFGGLFIGFSFFLILAAAMLVALMFRLGVERRSSEVGLLLALGFAPSRVTRILLADGALVAGLGAAMGLVVSAGYAWLMLAGLRTWWSDAVHAPFLSLHVSPRTLIIGYVAGLAVALLSIAWSIRGLTRLSPRSLIAGVVQAGGPAAATRPRRAPKIVAIGAAVLALILGVLPLLGNAVPETGAFFGSGACMLIALLAGLNHWLRVSHPHSAARRTPSTGRTPTPHRAGRRAMVRLGLRNVPRNPGRSVLTAALIASATFVIAALQAFHVDVDPASLDRRSGTGGFSLVATAVVPLQYDLNTPQGREALNVPQWPSDVRVWPFRLRDGDDSSCLNLYTPTRPRIIGATTAMIERGGFAFGATLAESDAERDNPWTLLNRTFPDGAVPAIGDEAAVKWQHHLGLGRDLLLPDEHNHQIRLRFVALLKGSALQNEIIIAEPRFAAAFPSISGYGFFLIETPPGESAATAATLERGLRPFGFDATSTTDRLTGYLAVQNTYLSTFQSLGGLGLILGTLGLAAVLLRNVWERRGELALMRAVGFSFAALRWLVLTENTALVLAGLIAGVVPAVVAVAPHIARAPASLPWLSVGGTLLAVFAIGTLSGVIALASALRSPLLDALRKE